MENTNQRTFTIVDSESQVTKEIRSTATTLAELKRDLVSAGFSVEGKAIQEGLTRTELVDDASMLPHDVPYRGTITNNLVFRLTKSNKKIESGIDRKEVNEMVKEKGLQGIIKERFGKNYTHVSTNDIMNLISELENEQCNTAVPQPYTGKAIERLCEILLREEVIDEEDKDYILNGEKIQAATVGVQPIYSSEELTSMFGNM